MFQLGSYCAVHYFCFPPFSIGPSFFPNTKDLISPVNYFGEHHKLVAIFAMIIMLFCVTFII